MECLVGDSLGAISYASWALWILLDFVVSPMIWFKAFSLNLVVCITFSRSPNEEAQLIVCSSFVFISLPVLSLIYEF